ncbi:L-rhamnose/proton symporter RhaT [Basfia succiniciproducens]|uniref:L-rhamnose-proton symport protein (RhaT) n=1 Tax=Basfia succiniciproducens TaxID=653940 RepID=A0A1G5DM58_9PAST|nr:L-rhamnose/proton symporter RhaT [Basfia succiniciproducens]QIM69466.1 rhamnose:proton symporter [Basfia succiniciproducens]SCY15488.1 L-rhamnose-proton symport protein (RhaT) [Basfia succiniciproducens]
MGGSILLGIFWHFVGATSAACFYAPMKKVTNWSWETMWAIAGIFSWILLPWGISYWLLPDFGSYYSFFGSDILLPVFLFGAMWGIGNIGYGLTMRYLGMSMGIGIAIGITLIVGTLMTPIIQGRFGELLASTGGQMTLIGVDPLYVALPSYVVIMGGGAIINLGFCIIRLITRPELSFKADMSVVKGLLISNILFSALGGIMWYFQFFFYAWGHANIPANYGFMSWMLHMSFYVLCGGIVGLLLHEWKDTGKKPTRVLCIGCLIIVLAANIVGLGMAN